MFSTFPYNVCSSLFYQGEKDENEFAHPFFLRGQEHLLDQIKRKVSVAGARQTHPQPQFLPSIKSEKVMRIQQLINQTQSSHGDQGVGLIVVLDRQLFMDTELIGQAQNVWLLLIKVCPRNLSSRT